MNTFNTRLIPLSPEAERTIRLHELQGDLEWPVALEFSIGDALAPTGENAVAVLRIVRRVWSFSTPPGSNRKPPVLSLYVEHIPGGEPGPIGIS